MKIRKAVIPAAGLGTRLLPATKAIPKEMLPVGRKPLIQYAVEEAAASGLDTAILVLPRGENLLLDHFREDPGLDVTLESGWRQDVLADLRVLSSSIEIRAVFQPAPRGLADAIGCARMALNNEPFAVILPDALIDPQQPCVGQLVECYQKHPGYILATREIGESEVQNFGILEVTPLSHAAVGGRVLQVISLIERPRPGATQSRYGIFGRYILEPSIFDCIDRIKPGFSGEFQLTDALQMILEKSPVYALRFEGSHHNAGDQLGLWQAVIHYALQDPELGARMREHLLHLNEAQLSRA